MWCEKPVALTEDELDAVRAAWLESGRVLAVGFNRRWSPAVAAARRALAGVAAAKLVVYRVAAGPVPDGHWYRDRRQGGRMLGEVCHFVDTAQALVGAPIEDVTALPGGGRAGRPTTRWWRCASRTARSPASATAAPSRRPGKEWIEVHAGAHRVVIDDFRSVTADGRRLWKGRQDKGHHALAAAFRQAVAGEAELPTEDMLATMRATIRAAAGVPGGGCRSWVDHVDQVRTLFDTKAAGWPEKYAADGRLAGRLAQLAGAAGELVAAGGELLDLGCGSGELARHLAAAGYRVTGCDIAPQMLRQAAAADCGARRPLDQARAQLARAAVRGRQPGRGGRGERARVRAGPGGGACRVRPGAAAGRGPAVHRAQPGPPGALAGMAARPGRAGAARPDRAGRPAPGRAVPRLPADLPPAAAGPLVVRGGQAGRA